MCNLPRRSLFGTWRNASFRQYRDYLAHGILEFRTLSDSLLNFHLVNCKGIPFLINDSYNHAMSCKIYQIFHSKCTYQDSTAFSHVLYEKLVEEYRFSPCLSLLNSSVSWISLPISSNSSARVCAILARFASHSRGGDPWSARNLLCASLQASGFTFKPEKNIN